MSLERLPLFEDGIAGALNERPVLLSTEALPRMAVVLRASEQPNGRLPLHERPCSTETGPVLLLNGCLTLEVDSVLVLNGMALELTRLKCSRCLASSARGG